MDANTYYSYLEKALLKLNEAIETIEKKSTDEFDSVDYSTVLNSLYKFRRQIVGMQNIHKFHKLSKESFIKKAENKTSNKIEISHTVKDYETPLSIASKYDVSLEDLLEINNLTSSEITAGTIIKVEVESGDDLTQVYNDIPTFGSQEGDLVLGKDAKINLDVDEDGDLKVLDPEETIKQGIISRLSSKTGDYPLDDTFGLDNLVGSEFPSSLLVNMAMMKISTQLALDSRIKSLNSIEVTKSQNEVDFQINVTAVNNKSLDITNEE